MHYGFRANFDHLENVAKIAREMHDSGVANHCSNIAVSVIEREDWQASKSHSYLRTLKPGDSEMFLKYFGEFSTGTDVTNMAMKAVSV